MNVKRKIVFEDDNECTETTTSRLNNNNKRKMSKIKDNVAEIRSDDDDTNDERVFDNYTCVDIGVEGEEEMEESSNESRKRMRPRY